MGVPGFALPSAKQILGVAGCVLASDGVGGVEESLKEKKYKVRLVFRDSAREEVLTVLFTVLPSTPRPGMETTICNQVVKICRKFQRTFVLQSSTSSAR